MVLKYLVEKEFKQMMRDALLPKLIIVFPCMMMLLMPWAASLEIKHNDVCVIDRDKSPMSRRLIEKIASTDYFDLSGYAVSYEEALAMVEADEADVILEIPENMEKNIVTGEGAVLQVSANAINGTKGSLGTSYLTTVIMDFFAAAGERAPVNISRQNLYNPHLDYKVFMLPALMAMLLTLMCGFLPALNIVGEKERGTMEQINVTPVGKVTFILAKLIPYWVVGVVVLSLCFLLAAVLYGVTPRGSLLGIYLFAGVYILVVSAVGLIISNYSTAMQQAMFVMFFFLIVFILMSGLFTPVRSMPQWAQWISAVNPLTYFIEAMRGLYLKGSSVSDLSGQMVKLLGFMAFFYIWAVRSYRKTE